MSDRYELLSDATGGRDEVRIPRSQRAVIHVRGPDAVEFLHRICSQDVTGLADGNVARAAFLTPKGKIVAVGMLGRAGEDVWIDVAGATCGALAEYLERFHFTERLEIQAYSERSCHTSLGAAAWAGEKPGLSVDGDRVTFRFAIGDVEVVRTFGGRADSTSDELADEFVDAVSMLLGDWSVGAELDDSTIASEAPIEDHISTDKGCYTGQEIVARIHTYGHVNRNVVMLRCAGDAPLEAGVALCDLEDGDPVGRVTRSARHPKGVLAVGYVPRDFAAAGTELRVGAIDGPVARVLDYGCLGPA